MNKFPTKPTIDWLPFSKEDFKSTDSKCNNLSAPEPNYVLWKHLKIIIENDKCLFNIINIINIANAWINIGYWLSHFKKSCSIVISKPNKIAYNSLKIFHPIILLNTLEKVIEKVIDERLQYQFIKANFIHPNQLDSLKHCLTTSTDVLFTYLIHSGWVKQAC